MTAAILGLGTAAPCNTISQEHAAEMAEAIYPRQAEEARRLAVLYRRTGVERRASVVLDGVNGDGRGGHFFPAAAHPADRGPTTGQRLARYADEAAPLAVAAARGALEQAGVMVESISHLITVSCTGFLAPGVDAALVHRLGLRPTVGRIHIGFMGCHGAINGLRVAAAFVGADSAARVLLCAVELCSLHFHYGPDPDKNIANALFADGAAAAVIGAGAEWRIAGTASCLVPESGGAMTWRIGDNGFEMTLSPQVPDLLHAHLRPWLEPWLADNGLAIGEIGSWAIHPGGPKIISTVADCLGLEPAQTAASRAVLADRGNMSSPTVLFIVDRLRRAAAARPCVAMAFGPGLVAEAALLR